MREEQKEMEPLSVATDYNGQVSKQALLYSHEKNELSKLTKLTTKDNSFVFSFSVENSICHEEILKIDEKKERQLLRKQDFYYNTELKTGIIEPILEEWVKVNHITVAEVSESSIAPNLRDYKATTINNDMIMVLGIDSDYASYLSNLVVDQKEDEKMATGEETVLLQVDEKGVGNTLMILIVLLLIGITLIGTIFFTIMNR